MISLMSDINESDWTLLREMNRIALDRLCDRILKDVLELASDPDKCAHVRYLAVWELIQNENKEIAAAFDGLRRSQAIMQLAHMRRLKLISDTEFAQFSPQSRESVHQFLKP